MNGQVKWQTLSRVSALKQEQRLKRRKSHAKTSVSIADSTVNKLKDDYYYLSSRFYAAIEIAFCYALFSVNPFSGWISKRALVESLSLEAIIPSVSHGIKVFVENIDRRPFQINKS